MQKENFGDHEIGYSHANIKAESHQVVSISFRVPSPFLSVVQTIPISKMVWNVPDLSTRTQERARGKVIGLGVSIASTKYFYNLIN